jgi:hypothetical protein
MGSWIGMNDVRVSIDAIDVSEKLICVYLEKKSQESVTGMM